MLVNQDTHGTIILTNAHVVNYQDKLLEVNVFAHHQKLFGVNHQKHAHVQPMPMVIIVLHVHHQEYGTTKITLVIVYHQKQSGTEPNVFAHQTDLDHHALNAQLQDIGTTKAINVFVKNHSSGTELTVYAQAHISYIKEDVLNAQTDILGKITNVKLAHVPSKIYKSLEVESDTFIEFIVKK